MKAGELKQQYECLSRIMTITKESGHPWHYLLGNHDFSCFAREELYKYYYVDLHEGELNNISTQCEPGRLYYSFSPQPGYRFIVLDGYDVSTIGASSPVHARMAEDIIMFNNPNFRKTPVGNWLEGLDDSLKKYVPFNGAIGDDQKVWLREQLAGADEIAEKCIVFCHVSCYEQPGEPTCLLWNDADVIDILQRSSSVIAFIAGHDHTGGYTMDEYGIHHIVPPAPLECQEGEPAFGHVDMHADHMTLHWTGKKPKWTEWPSQFRFNRRVKA